MSKIWIIGAGKFGRRAAEIMAHGNGSANITVVDPDFEKSDKLGCSFVQQNGISFLSKFGPEHSKDWVIPALPLHLAYHWLEKRWQRLFRFVKVNPNPFLMSILPNLISVEDGRFFASIADFLCPEDCPEPKSYCYHTGKKREYDLFDFIKETGQDSFFTIVVRSLQRARGVGGFRFEALLKAEKKIIMDYPGNKPVLLATACRCHSVIDIFELQRNRSNR